MATYTNCRPANTNTGVNVYESMSTSSTFLGNVTGNLSADDAGNNINWIHITSPYQGYADRFTVDTAYADDLSVSFFGGTGTSNQLQQSSVKKIAVVNLQFALRRLGYDVGTIDGIFGSKTKEEVEKFQRKYGLQVDGIVGDDTKEELIKQLNGLGR